MKAFRALLGPVLLSPILVSSAASCSRSGGGEGAFFKDVTGRSGIDFRLSNGASGEHYLIETMVGGLGWIDYDGDGDSDLFLVNGHSDPLHADEPGREEDRLYRNDGAGRFTDVTALAGVGDRRYGNGAAVGDYDGDGDPDLLVLNFGRNTLYRNEGAGAFSDVTEAAGLAERGYNTSAAWFDMDRDGDLDLYVARYLRYDPRSSRRCRDRGRLIYCSPKLFPGEEDLLYRNLGNGTFEEIGARAGIGRAGGTEGKGLGVAAADFDRDGWTDLFVANDTTPNFLWRNEGGRAFTDIASAAGAALSADGRPQSGMGVDVADVNGDGFTDIYVTNFSLELNSLYLGEQGGRFAERSRARNLGGTYLPLGFGTLFVDVDLDGDQDIVTANGHVDDLVETTQPGMGISYRQPASLFLNDGAGSFEEAPEKGGDYFREPSVGRGLARADIDGDGDPDLAAMTLDRSLVLLRNENPLGNRAVSIRLIGRRSPRDGYGARVEAEIEGRRQVFEYQSARSYLSASDPRLAVGLGKRSRIDRLVIHWPSGTVQELKGVEAPGPITVREPE